MAPRVPERSNQLDYRKGSAILSLSPALSEAAGKAILSLSPVLSEAEGNDCEQPLRLRASHQLAP